MSPSSSCPCGGKRCADSDGPGPGGCGGGGACRNDGNACDSPNCCKKKSASSSAAVALPPRDPSVVSNARSTPVWTVSPSSDADADADDTLAGKCDRHQRPMGLCCKELKGDDERQLLDPDVVRDVIIGLSDGLTVPFALTAGLAGLGDSRIVYIGGLAELISGAISMGVGGYLASEAERDHYRYLRRTTRERVARSCQGEMEREVHEVLGKVGVDEPLSRLVAESLLRVEEEIAVPAAQAAALEHKQRTWLRRFATCFARKPKTSPSAVTGEEAQSLRWGEDVGLTAFLLQFGEGMEEVSDARLWISALTIGAGYFFGGLIPLLPYFFVKDAMTGLLYSCILTAIILLLFGAFKTYYTGARTGFAGYLKGSFGMLGVGGAAAACSYAIVYAVET